MDFDRVLAECGNWNRYQMAVLLMHGYICVLSSFHYFSQTLITFTPEHWCHHEKLSNLSHAEIRSVYAQTEQPSCTLLADVLNGSVAQVAPEDAECEKWIFAYERNYESITTELQWVCSRAFQSAFGQSFFFVGSVVGTIFFGFLGDRIGRLPALILTTLAGASGDFITSFAYSVPAFAIGRFISGISTDTIFYMSYIIVFEYLHPQRRTLGLNIAITFFYCFGVMVSPWLAVLVGTWRRYLLIASLPALGILLIPLYICESAQWLITKGHYKRAVNSLKHVARCNGRQVPDSVFEQFVEFYKQKQQEEKLMNQSDTFFGMLRSPRLRKFTIILLIKSIIITLAFDTISRNMEGLGTPPFELFSYTGIAYIPGGFTLILLQDRIGRKGATITCLFIGGLITVFTGFLIAFLDRDVYAMLLAIMVGLGRYGVIVAYDAEVQYAAEIIPTSVRGQGVSNIHVVGLACTFLSAYVIYLGNFYKPLPSIFIGVIMLIGALLCLTLPETLNRKLPETLSEGEMFGLHEKWYYFSCFDRQQNQQHKQQHQQIETITKPLPKKASA